MSDCIFCKIISGEIPSYTVYRDDEFVAILDRFPSAEGHMLVLPIAHAANIYEMDSALTGRLFMLVNRLAKKLKDELNCDGLNILQNNGEAAGQTVGHFHVHLIPRRKDDGIDIKWPNQDPPPEEFDAMVKRLKTE